MNKNELQKYVVENIPIVKDMGKQIKKRPKNFGL
jgi:hypothetical protein